MPEVLTGFVVLGLIVAAGIIRVERVLREILAALADRTETPATLPVLPPPPEVLPPPSPVVRGKRRLERPDIWSVLSRNGEEWSPTGVRVRGGSPDWRRYHSCPGYALRSESGQIEEGVQ